MIQGTFMRPPPTDCFDVARKAARDEWVKTQPWYFLLSVDPFGAFEPREDPTPIAALEDRASFLSRSETGEVLDEPLPSPALLLLPLRKTTASARDQITVGRLASNDVVVPDYRVSRTHAFFRVYPDRITLADAGAANGTRVDGRLLDAAASPTLVIPGSRVRFAQLEFELLDAQTAWRRVRDLVG
jgi:hypothetical protein